MEAKLKEVIIYAFSVWEFLPILYSISRTILFIHFNYSYCWTNYSGGVYLSLVCIYFIDAFIPIAFDVWIWQSCTVVDVVFAENEPINRNKLSIVTYCQQSERNLFLNRKCIDHEPIESEGRRDGHSLLHFFKMLYVPIKKTIQSNLNTRTLNKAVLY